MAAFSFYIWKILINFNGSFVFEYTINIRVASLGGNLEKKRQNTVNTNRNGDTLPPFFKRVLSWLDIIEFSTITYNDFLSIQKKMVHVSVAEYSRKVW